VEQIPNLGQIILFGAFVMPGVVSLSIYGLLMPTRPLEWKDVLVQGLFYTLVNYALLVLAVAYIVNPAHLQSNPIEYWALVILVLVVGPIAWPVLWKWLLGTPLARQFLPSPYPTAWDYFFARRETAFVLIRLNDGTFIGGYFGPGSFASAFPAEGDMYLSATYKVDADGKFLEAVRGTRGVLIRKDQYSLIQIFEVPAK